MSLIRRVASTLRDTLILPHSPVEYLLNSNACPTEDEKEAITTYIADLEKEHLRLRALPVISIANSSEMFSGTKLTAYAEAIESHRNLLSPVRRLPVELLREVFLHCNVHRYALGGGRWSYLPFNLSQVCRLWRETTLSMPDLWDHIPCVDTNVPEARHKSYLSFLADILSRSKGRLLSIHIIGKDPTPTHRTTTAFLLADCERWRELGLSTTARAFVSFFPMEGRLASLQRLTLDLGRHPNSHDAVFPSNPFATAPLLTEVTIARETTCLIPFPFRQLTTLRDACSQHMISEAILEQCRNLKHLEITSTAHQPLVGLRRLTKLTSLSINISQSQMRSRSRYLDHLVLPELQELSVARYRGSLLKAIIALVRRSSESSMSSLRKLKLLRINPAPAEGYLTSLLKHTPLLEDLEIDLPTPFDILCLRPKRVAWTPVPKLRRLVFHPNGQHLHDARNSIMEVARIRCRIPSRTSGHGSDTDLEKGVERLKDFEIRFGFRSACWAAQNVLLRREDHNDVSFNQQSASLSDLQSASSSSTSRAQSLPTTPSAVPKNDSGGDIWLFEMFVYALDQLVLEYQPRPNHDKKHLQYRVERVHSAISDLERRSIDMAGYHDIYETRLHLSL